MNRGMTTFKSVRDTIPEFLPMTPEEKDAMGEQMGLPMDKWSLLEKRAVLCLPQTTVCSAWCKWAERNHALPAGAGFMLMHPNVYNTRFGDGPSHLRTNLQSHTADMQDEAIHTTGSPLVNWNFTFCVMEE